MNTEFVYSPIKSIDQSFADKCWQRLYSRCVPPNSLGLLDRLGVRIAVIQHTLEPDLGVPAFIIGAGDHGVYRRQVSFAPRSITWQHSINMMQGGGVAGLFSRKYGMKLQICDVGVDHDFAAEDGVTNCKVAYGTKDLSVEPAMTLEQCIKAMNYGRQAVLQASQAGAKSIIFGEMGIANTTPASVVTAAILKTSVELCVGSGTGMGQNALLNKQNVVRQALERHQNAHTPVEIMAAMGGLELAFIMGGALEAAGQGMVILLDGFIVTAAVLAACMLDSKVKDYLVACHASNEPGHRLQLEYLGLEPVLQMGLCLGEGSGALLSWPMMVTACQAFREINSFADGGLENAAESVTSAKSNDADFRADGMQ